MPQREIRFLNWPRLGLVENAAFAQQNPEATLDALNVRNYDQFDRKLRGGQRTGIAKAFDSTVDGSKEVQNISEITRAVALEESAGIDSKYADPGSGQLNFGGRWCAFSPDGNYFAWVSSDDLYIHGFDISTGFGGSSDSIDLGNGDILKIQWSADSQYVIALVKDTAGAGSDDAVLIVSWDGTTLTEEDELNVGTNGRGFDISPDETRIAVSHDGDLSIYAIDLTNGSFGSQVGSTQTASTSNADGVAFHPTGSWVAVAINVDPNIRLYEFDNSTGIGSEVSFPGGATISNEQFYDVFWNSDGNLIYLGMRESSSDVFTWSFDPSDGSWGTQQSGPPADDRGLSGAISPNGNYLAAWSRDSGNVGIEVYNYSSGGFGSLVDSVAISGGGTFSPGDGKMAWHPSGNAIGMQLTDELDDPTVRVYAFSPATVNPTALEKRVVAVSGGSVYRSDVDLSLLSLVNSGSSAVRTDGLPVGSATAFQKLFFADGLAASYQYLDFSDNTVKDWSSDVTAGNLPVGTDDSSIGCRIITLYRGRIVLSGLKEEPQNWFMSRSGDPFDWDYSPATSSATQPVAGNNSDAGELGDVITALAPYNDDVMIMGGPNSLWVMRGDPAAGGAIDNITRQIGIVGADAWTWDTAGTLYFFGVNGLYRMQAGGAVPEHLSRNRLDKTFAEVDLSANKVILIYDPIWQGVHIFISALREPSTAPTHYFWDERNDAFWPDQYTTGIGPAVVGEFAGNTPGDRRVFLGGYDGFIREFDPDAKDDDGTAISSRIRFAPITPGNILASGRMEDITVVTDTASDDITLEVYAGPTPEEANDAAAALTSPRLKRTIQGGRNITIRNRIAQNTMIPVLRNGESDESWAFERAAATVEVLNRMKQNRVT